MKTNQAKLWRESQTLRGSEGEKLHLKAFFSSKATDSMDGARKIKPRPDNKHRLGCSTQLSPRPSQAVEKQQETTTIRVTWPKSSTTPRY